MLEGGVPEIDYRQSGGFVPMGKKKKQMMSQRCYQKMSLL